MSEAKIVLIVVFICQNCIRRIQDALPLCLYEAPIYHRRGYLGCNQNSKAVIFVIATRGSHLVMSVVVVVVVLPMPLFSDFQECPQAQLSRWLLLIKLHASWWYCINNLIRMWYWDRRQHDSCFVEKAYKTAGVIVQYFYFVVFVLSFLAIL